MIEAPLVESALNLAAEEVLEFSAFGRIGERLGNRCRERAHRASTVVRATSNGSPFPSRTSSGLRWWNCSAHPSGRRIPHCRPSPGVSTHMISLIGTSPTGSGAQRRDDAVDRLLAAGVAAAPVVDNRDVVTHAVFEARGFAEWSDHPVDRPPPGHHTALPLVGDRPVDPLSGPDARSAQSRGAVLHPRTRQGGDRTAGGGRRDRYAPGRPIAATGPAESTRQRGARGMPRPTMAMMSRWISFVPPPKVKMVWARAFRSSRPCSTAAGDPSGR